MSVAALLGQPELQITHSFALHCTALLPSFDYCFHQRIALESPLTLTRGSALLVGGDLVYPEPSPITWAKFELPFSLALTLPTQLNESRVALSALLKHPTPMVDWIEWGRAKTLWLEILTQIIGTRLMGVQPSEGEVFSHNKDVVLDDVVANAQAAPAMWAIPGNHDVLDSLAMFNLEILEETTLGSYRLPQDRPYFALKVGAFGIFGMHDMHAAGSHNAQDLDRGQFDYFEKQLMLLRAEGISKLVFVLHFPFMFASRSYVGARMRKLVARIEKMDMHIRLLVFGDMHFEATYAPQRPSDPHVIICGGGGAFLETTAHLPKNLLFDLGNGLVNLTMQGQSFPSSSEWKFDLMPRGVPELLFHPTLFTLGWAFSMLFIVVLKLFFPYALRSSDMISLWLVYVAVVVITTQSFVSAVMAIFGGFLMLFFVVVERIIAEDDLWLFPLSVVSSHGPVLLLSLLFTFVAPIALVERMKFELAAMNLLSCFFFLFEAVHVLLNFFRSWMAKTKERFMSEPRLRPTGLVPFFLFFMRMFIGRLLSFAIFLLVFSVSAFYYSILHCIMIIVLHHLNIAASSMSSLLALEGYKSFLKFRFVGDLLEVYHLGMIDLPALVNASYVKEASGLYHVAFEGLQGTLGLIRKTIVN